jgi:hypothetical protein
MREQKLIMTLRRGDVTTQQITNSEADEVFLEKYWLKRKRHSRRLSYGVFWKGEKVAWVQVADLFGTLLPKPLQMYSIGEAIEVCRGYFLESAPSNIESCGIANILRRLPNDWFQKFGVEKKIAIIYQDMDYGQKGIVYKAMGFNPIGETTHGRHYKSSSRGNSLGTKIIWARALRPISGAHYQIELPTV